MHINQYNRLTRKMHSLSSRIFLITIGMMIVAGFESKLSAQATDDGLYTEISGSGQSLLSISVAPVKVSSGKATSGVTIQNVLSNDLKLFGLFKLVDSRAYLGNLATEGMSVKPEEWKKIGAQAVVKGALQGSAGGHLSATMYLYDLARGTTAVVSKSYSGSNARVIAHQFGDEVVKYFTKEAGFFTSKIAFASKSRGGSSIYMMDYDGHGAHKVSRGGKKNILPALSRSGKLAYTGFLWQNPDLYIASPGKRARRVAKYPGLNSDATWSPGGSKLAVTLSKDGNSEVYVITSSGKIANRITDHPGIDTSPTFSPNGAQLAFVSDRAGSPQIYMAMATGGRATRLTHTGKYNQEPAWNPNPKYPLVAFTGRDAKGRYDIFTINVKTKEIVRVTQGSSSAHSPSWAANGRVLCYVTNRGIWLTTKEGLNPQLVYRGNADTPSWAN